MPAKELEEIAIFVDRRTVASLARDAGLPVEDDDPAAEAIPPNSSPLTTKNNLQMIGLAFHNHHDLYSKFPKAGGPAEATDTNKDGLSWRVQLLPYLDEGELYREFHLDEPWDSDHNRTLIERMPAVFAVDGVEEPGKTSIHVFTSQEALCQGNRMLKPMSPNDLRFRRKMPVKNDQYLAGFRGSFLTA